MVASVTGAGRRRRSAARATSGSSRGTRGRERARAEVGLTLGQTELVGLTPADWAGLMGQFGQVYLGHCPINHLIIIRKIYLKNKTDTTKLLLLNKHENNATTKINS
jgi:hypothetical protein